MSELRETEFGIVASDWRFIPSTEYCLKITDGTHDSPKEQKVGKHLITSKHIKGKNVDFENAYLISEDDYNKINERSKVDQWDVLISMIGEYCGFSFVERNKEINYAVKNVGLFKTGNKKKAYWFYYFLNSKIGRFILETNKSGTSQPYLTLGFLRDFPVLYPNTEQEATVIVEILSSLDDKIDLLHRQNKTLEQLAETLFRQWFVEEASESWEVGTLEDEFDFTMGQSPPGNSYNEIGDGIVFFQGRTDFDFRFPKTRMFTSQPSRYAKPFDTLVSVRAPVGDMNMAYTDCCIGRGLSAFRYKHSSTFYSYAYYKLRSLMQQIKQFEDNGTVFGSITKDDFSRLKNIIPTIELINSFQSKVKPVDEKIFSNYNQIRILTQLRDTLLPKLMSGEVRVN